MASVRGCLAPARRGSPVTHTGALRRLPRVYRALAAVAAAAAAAACLRGPTAA
eukprot:CAMPEP_0195149340 /NCGR_PEP_ID=MMETSP0448-20130528/176896_1 /TAXON_ID=66468 /ORGANISM="Heterocapsa triquestra, Strain CCMP 448" /LENGTH=52 /DNA_ID=CAMNT_0040187985 /DNA_START=1 /DNA_END=155 /DNA_ORIENTATION=+